MIILCGKSSAGKDRILNQLVDKYGVQPLISDTTRPMRDGETDGKEYNFITKKQFLQNDYVEHRSYDTLLNGIPDTWYYGLRKFDRSTALDDVMAVIVDAKGAIEVKQYCEEIEEPCLCVYVDTDTDIRERRARLRGGFNEQEWNRRLKADEKDFAPDKLNVVNYEVFNNVDGDAAVDKIANEILTVHKMLATEAYTCNNMHEMR